ncbi:MAG: cytidyltransferase-like protein [Spartobacteria bacterium]|nr:cytidyltransferase-like protein [Spartobacteria bacterium]
MYDVVYVIGVFDLFHRGHVELLRRSKTMGRKLLVSINGDEMVAQYKARPFFSEEERLAVVQACRYVDEAFIIRQFDNRQVLLDYGVSAIVHGTDWEEDSYLRQIRVTRDFLREHNIEMLFIPYTEGISTTDIIRKIQQSEPR